MSPTLRRRAAIALAGYSVVLAWVLLNPSASVPSGTVSVLGAIGDALGLPGRLTVGSRIEFALNALILAPVSALGLVVWPRTTWRDWTAYGFAISGGVELFQALLLSGRSATMVDIVANTLGAAVGAVVATWALARWGPQPEDGAERGARPGRPTA